MRWWRDEVRCGAVRCGVVVVWYGVVQCGKVWCAVVCCGVLWCAVVCCAVLWCGVVVVWYGVQCGVLW